MIREQIIQVEEKKKILKFVRGTNLNSIPQMLSNIINNNNIIIIHFIILFYLLIIYF